jgi:hypothetical protein
VQQKPSHSVGLWMLLDKLLRNIKAHKGGQGQTGERINATCLGNKVHESPRSAATCCRHTLDPVRHERERSSFIVRQQTAGHLATKHFALHRLQGLSTTNCIAIRSLTIVVGRTKVNVILNPSLPSLNG